MQLPMKLVFYRNAIRIKLLRAGLITHKFKSIRLNPSKDLNGMFSLKNAVIDSVSGYIFDEDLNFIEQSASWGSDNAGKRWPAVPCSPKVISSNSPTVFLGSSAYYHWLIEDLPAYLKAKISNPEASTLIRKSSPRYVLDVLNILEEKFVEIPVYSKVPNLIFSEKSEALKPLLSDLQLILSVKDKIAPTQQKHEKLYISRSLSGRVPANEFEIEELFRDFGFKTIHLENLKLDNQISLFQNADIISGTHGAGLANLVWAKEGCKVIELARLGQPDCFGQIAQLMKLDYTVLESSTDPWKVDLENLKTLLKGIELKNL